MRYIHKKTIEKSAFPKWLIALFLLLVFSILIGGYRFYLNNDRQLRLKAEDELGAISRLKTDEIATWRAERLADASYITEDPFFESAIADWMTKQSPELTDQIRAKFKTLLRNHNYNNVLLVDADGTVRLNLSGTPSRLAAETLQQLAIALRENKSILTDFHLDPESNTPELDLIVPLSDPEGNARPPSFAVIMSINPSYFLYPLIQSWPTPSQSAETLLIRRDGNDALFLNELRHRSNAALRLRIPLSETKVPSVKAVLGERGIVQGIDYRGVRVMAFLSPIPDSTWFMVAKVDMDEAFAANRYESELIVGTVLGLLGVTFAVTGLFLQDTQKKHYRVAYELERDRRQADEALQRSEEKYRDLVNGINEGMFVHDNQGVITFANQALVNMHGFKGPEEIVGRKFTELVSPAAANDALDIFKKGMETGNYPKVINSRIIRSDGSEAFVEIKPSIVRDDSGRVVSVRGVIQDVTERKRAEEEILRLNSELEKRVIERTAELEAANRELESFSYSVSHDLRSPLRHIVGFVELLQKEASSKLDEDSQRYMNTIQDSAKRMGDLIDDLLSFSRIGRSEMKKSRFSLDKLVNEVLAELHTATEGRDIIWEISALPEAYGDHNLLRLVLQNLISNAVKYTSKRPEAKIEVGYIDNKKDEIVIFVRDNGAGFDMKYADKLFGVFQRLHAQDEFEGTGIGLATVRRIIQRHGGRTWAEGSVNGGATFYFSLPTGDSTPGHRDVKNSVNT